MQVPVMEECGSMKKLAEIAKRAAESKFSPGVVGGKLGKWGLKAMGDGPMAGINFASSAFNRIKNQGFSTTGERLGG